MSKQKRIGPALALQLKPCEDPNSREYRNHRWVVWGDDPRYKRCSRCGKIDADAISSEARYGRGQKQPERPVKHRHQFETCAFDWRYERCFCGASRRIRILTSSDGSDGEKPVAGAQMQPTRVVHVRRDAFDQYIGRLMARYPGLHSTGFGNPFTVRNLPKGYDNAVDAYRDWLLGKPAFAGFEPHVRNRVLARLSDVRGKVLGCWCAPKGGIGGDLYGHTCHGEVLAALADQLISAVDVAVDVGEKRGEGVSCERA